jgi:hypothetical protein
MNAIEVVTRVVERFSSGPWLDRIGAFFEHVFSVENMKAFAKALYMAFLVVKDFFTGDFSDYWTVMKIEALSFFQLVKLQIVDIGGRFQRLFTMLAAAMKGFNPLSPGSWAGIGAAFGCLSQSGVPAGMAQQQLFEALGLMGEKQGAMGRIAARAASRKGAMKNIDDLFAGLGGKGPGDTKAANFGSLFGAGGKTGLDAITELILGGGQLARLGVKPSEVGGFKFLSKDKPIKVDVRAGSTAANAYFKQLFEEFLAEAVRSGRVAVPGGL